MESSLRQITPSSLPVFNMKWEMTAILTDNIAKLNDRSEKPISASSGNKAQTRKVCVCVGGGGGRCYSTPYMGDKLGIIWKNFKGTLRWATFSGEYATATHCRLFLTISGVSWATMSHYLPSVTEYRTAFWEFYQEISQLTIADMYSRKEGKRKRQIFWFVCRELPLCSVHAYGVVCIDLRLNCLELRCISH